MSESDRETQPTRSNLWGRRILVTGYLDPDAFEEFQALARRRERSMAAELRNAVAQHLRRARRKDAA